MFDLQGVYVGTLHHGRRENIPLCKDVIGKEELIVRDVIT